MAADKIIVIGASAGGFEAIQGLVANLPRGLPASIFIVWHMSPEVRGVLPGVLNRYNTLPAFHARDGEEIKEGHIYVAPPDRHLLVENGRIRVTHGPKENRFRPAVDPLFRSAAYTYGPAVIGIVLSGSLDDGTAGLWMIKHFGGTTIVQHPSDAAVPSMPRSALREVKVDYSMPVADMPLLLEELCNNPPAAGQPSVNLPAEEQKEIQQEIRVAAGDKSAGLEILRFGASSPYICPECHGPLFTLHNGNITRYRCHTGHAYSADSLLSAITETIEMSLWRVIQEIEESVMLLNSTGDHYAEQNDLKLAAQYFQKALKAGERLQALKDMAATTESLSRDRLEQE